MIVVSNTTAQTIAPGESITFDNVLLRTGGNDAAECFRRDTDSVKLRRNAPYSISFNANIGGPTAASPVELSLTHGKETVVGTTMISVPAAADDLNNVAFHRYLFNCCCDLSRIRITNTGENSVIVGANSELNVKRIG